MQSLQWTRRTEGRRVSHFTAEAVGRDGDLRDINFVHFARGVHLLHVGAGPALHAELTAT